MTDNTNSQRQAKYRDRQKEKGKRLNIWLTHEQFENLKMLKRLRGKKTMADYVEDLIEQEWKNIRF